MVMARRLTHPRYAGLVGDQATFAHEASTLHVVRLRRRVWTRLDRVAPGLPAAVFVGDRFLPRHVVLVTGAGDGRARTYEPASGLDLDVDRHRWERGDLALAGWDRPWFVVSPAR